MNFWYVPIGLVIGIVVAAPVGPVNLICLNRGLAYGALSAFAVGIGAAVGDAVFAAIAGFGIATFTDLITASRDPIRFAGGVIMLGFAYVVWRSQPPVDTDKQAFIPAWRQAIATFFMTITNPATLMGFTAIFAGTGFKKLGIRSPEHLANSMALVCGVLLGSLLWWAVLAFLAGTMQNRISNHTLIKINHASAIILGLFGIAAILASLLK